MRRSKRREDFVAKSLTTSLDWSIKAAALQLAIEKLAL
jgi:hypothetical protein